MNRTQEHQAPVRVAAAIRRPDPADLAALTSFFAGLSLRTRVQRFFAPVRPTPALVRHACGCAGHADVLVATHAGVIIGHAMAADRAAPPEGLATEIGVVVADAWQGQGVGSALVRTLISRAQARGVTSLSMDVLPDNHQVLAMIAGHWSAARPQRTADSVTIRVGLPPQDRVASHASSSRAKRRTKTSATARVRTTPGLIASSVQVRVSGSLPLPASTRSAAVRAPRDWALAIRSLLVPARSPLPASAAGGAPGATARRLRGSRVSSPTLWFWAAWGRRTVGRRRC